MIVVIGGMARSGSTFSFNVARELLELHGSVEVAFANSIDASVCSRSTEEHFVLKTHGPDDHLLAQIKSGSVKCICTVRRPEDAVASLMRTFGFSFEKSIESIEHWLMWYFRVLDQVMTLEFQIIDCERRLAIERIVEYIGMHCERTFIESLEEKYEKLALKQKYDSLVSSEQTVDIGFSYYDKRTFFHRRHISHVDAHPVDHDVSPLQLERIRAMLRAHIDRFFLGKREKLPLVLCR